MPDRSITTADPVGGALLLCLGCRAFSRGATLRDGVGCPRCAGSRFLRAADAPSAFRVLDLAARPVR